MFRSIVWYLNFAFTLLFTLPKLRKVNTWDKNILSEEEKLKRDDFVFKYVSKWAQNKIKLAGATVKIFGEENIPKNETVLFMSNHQSNFDIALFLACIKTKKGFVAKLELGKIPILNQWMKKIDCVFMDRSSIRKSAEAIAEATKLLKNGRSMVIFPEGTRSKTGALSDFKAGSFKLATKPKVPIVPVTLDGTYKLMEAQGGKVKPATVNMYIHPPIETANLTKEEQLELPERVKAIIASKLPNNGQGELNL